MRAHETKRKRCSLFNRLRILLSFGSPSNAVLTRAIESVEDPLDPNDSDLLLLKAISAASTHCLFQCMNLLQRQHEANIRPETAA